MDRITNRTEFMPIAGIRTDSNQKTSGTGFEDLLKSAMTSTPSSDPVATQGILPPPRAMAFSEISESSGVEMRIQDMLKTMEEFSAALMDPEQSFRELSPMADALGEEAESLFSQSADKENPVQDFARRTALVARVEVEKFRRGDFM